MPNDKPQINIREELLATFGPEVVSFLKDLSIFFRAKQINSYLVGGMVRDSLLSVPSVDIDIALDGAGQADMFAAIQDLSNNWQSRMSSNLTPESCESHPRFLTAKINFPVAIFGKCYCLDFAVARTESYPGPGMRPTVSVTTLEKDLLRRDFSVNAMALELDEAIFGNVIDPCGGVEDVEKKQLRVLHPQSFYDDPVRILRGLRLAARLGFAWELATQELAGKALSLDIYRNVSPARRFDELRKALSEDREGSVLAVYNSKALLRQSFDVEGLEIAKNLDMAIVSRVAEDEMCPLWQIRLVMIFLPTSPDIFLTMLESVGMSRTLRKNLSLLHEQMRK